MKSLRQARTIPQNPQTPKFLLRAAGDGPWADAIIADVARGQAGISQRSQLVERGIPEHLIDWRAANSRLHIVHAGTYASSPAPGVEGLRWAAYLRTGPGSCISHRTSCMLWRAWVKHPVSTIDVSTPRDIRAKLAGVRVHPRRADLAPDITTINGLPVTTPARTVVDLGEMLDRYQLARVISEFQFRDLLRCRDVTEVLDRVHPRSNKVRRAVLAAVDLYLGGEHGTFSELERMLILELERLGIPLPIINAWLDLDGTPTLIDMRWEDAGLVAEVDGRTTHKRAPVQRADAERDIALRQLGYRQIRFTEQEIREDVTRCARILGRALGVPGM